MTVSFGSGQTNGLPLLVTAITQGTRQTLHTFPVGSATPNLVQLFAINEGAIGYTLNIAIEDSGATLLRLITVAVPVGGGMFDVLSGDSADDAALIQNGASTIKVWANVASVLAVSARVDDQAGSTGVTSMVLASGLIAAVQNAARYGMFVNGGVGSATEANHQITMPRAGTLRNLRSKPDAAVGGGATVTCNVRVNGAASNLSSTFVNADGTTAKTDTDSVAVVAGDLVTFGVTTDNAGAPAANFQLSVELV